MYNIATEQQIEANRANAQKSTGPKTEEGKVRVAQNAITHGMLARRLIICTGDGAEDTDEMEELIRRMREDLNPQGAMEECLVEEVIRCVVQLRRAIRAETGSLRLTMDSFRHRQREQADRLLHAHINAFTEQAEAPRHVIGPGNDHRRDTLLKLHDSSGGLGWLIERLEEADGQIVEQGCIDTAARYYVEPFRHDDSRPAVELFYLLGRSEGSRKDKTPIDPVLQRVRALKVELEQLREEAECREEMELDARLMTLALPSEEMMGKSQRYITAITRQREQALAALYKRQDRRQAQE